MKLDNGFQTEIAKLNFAIRLDNGFQIGVFFELYPKPNLRLDLRKDFRLKSKWNLSLELKYF